MIRKFQLQNHDSSIRLDQFLARQLPEHSRAYLQKLIQAGKTALDGQTILSNKYPLPGKGTLSIDLPEITGNEPIKSEDFTFELLYEDEYMAVINKPPGVVVHPAPGNPDGTVVNAILSRYPELRSADLPDGSRPGIVHRLDKDTSGCLVIARTPEAQFKLCAAFAERRTSKCYLALTAGIPDPARGRLENLIGRHPVNRQKMAIVQRNGKLAISEYEVLATGQLAKRPAALVKVHIYTGRTHQIRVHLSSLKCPVLGDDLYGHRSVSPAISRQMLHAWRLRIPHPVFDREIQIEAPLPPDFSAICRTVCSK